MRVDLDDFERMYRSTADPWGFATSTYEQHRYDTTIAALPREHYRRCLEPGCSVGALTVRLAAVADEVTALESSSTAVAAAVRRVSEMAVTGRAPGRVEVVQGAIPEKMPPGTFDLIVFSEIGYYWDEVELRVVLARMFESLEPGGDLVAVHWLGQSPDHLLAGADVHRILGGIARRGAARHLLTTVVVGSNEAGFIIDVWRR